MNPKPPSLVRLNRFRLRAGMQASYAEPGRSVDKWHMYTDDLTENAKWEEDPLPPVAAGT